MHRMFDVSPCWRLGAWLRPDSQGIWHFKVGGGRSPQSGPRLDARLLRQSVLEELTNLPRMESPQQGDRNKSDHGKRRREARRGGAVADATSILFRFDSEKFKVRYNKAAIVLIRSELWL
ncbi:FBD-associated F-box protein-like [Dorcoceras hygrometricum]|uniref:FBD-associated F-box protein-like n=1 Tax=Dorcoceras hygrometricum TaxID=472368 RepID=A0A2Z6ZRL1_9LAMI|nr:FBD-associated F-box protein-like [Dorcoceras hygrometricum]